MMELEQLKSWFEDIWNIQVDLNISINNAKRMIADKKEDENAILRWGFFSHHIYQLKFVMIIQLAKLYGNSSNQKRNLHRLCNLIANSKYDAALNSQLNDNLQLEGDLIRSRSDFVQEVDWIKEQFETHAVQINKVVNARDRVYAHSDPDQQVQQIGFNELEDLIKLVSRIYNRLHGKLFRVTTIFNHTPAWEVDGIILRLAEHLKWQIQQASIK